jgi:hypothetical protein
MKTLTRLFAAALAMLAAPCASAHTQSYAFLTASVEAGSATGRVDLAVRDLDLQYALDADGDGRITWGEFRVREPEIVPAVLGRISIGGPDGPCSLGGRPALVDRRGGEAYIAIPFEGSCPPSGKRIDVAYDLLFDLDAQHRALAAVTVGGATRSFVMTPDARSVSLDTAGADVGLFFTFVAHGAHHIWIGYDHILFLVTLLLGAVVTRRDGRWVPVDSLGSALLAILKVVTSFTLAHSLTLGLAAFGVLRLPIALTESVIAATIVLAAFNNIVPVVTRRIWLVAFLFGLIHGVGFANVLADLDLPREGLLTALLAFNLGVELGQVAIVAVVLPLLVLAGRRPIYGRVALPVASLAVATVGAVWFVERTMGIVIVSSG